jgi:hypothetical protein
MTMLPKGTITSMQHEFAFRRGLGRARSSIIGRDYEDRIKIPAT